MKPRILFILKRRGSVYGYSGGYVNGLSTGLYNSAFFVHDMLLKSGLDSKMVVVTDNNDIDREVSQYRPTHVIIEALWVVPSKFEILCKLHPDVKWIIRLHSETPFLANEGMAMKWIPSYLDFPNVFVGVNSLRFREDLSAILWWGVKDKVLYLPNYYPTDSFECTRPVEKSAVIRIGCFGAIRPLKNQLAQALAAIKFANKMHVRLEFHINAERVEMKGLPVLSNLEELFETNSSGHTLVKHQWLEHCEFTELLSKMDLCMQVSFSETFNIVAADSVASGVPTIMSPEIPWADAGFASPTDVASMVSALKRAWRFRKINVGLNQMSLAAFSRMAQRTWTKRSLWD